jgi:hypothetical protein
LLSASESSRLNSSLRRLSAFFHVSTAE